jgi:PKD repeat protein
MREMWCTEQWETPVTAKSWILTSGDGLKTVYYQLKDSAGLTSTYSSSITLDENTPVANAGPNQTANAGSPVTFDASGSTDNVGIVGYGWDFGDGTNGTGKTATHTYSGSGTYTAKLTAQDAAGNTAISSVTITVQSIAIPEFPSALLLALFVTITLIASLIYKRKSREG